MHITIHIASQELVLHTPEGKRVYSISSGANGVGQENGSYQTPLGKHIIRARIGEGLPENAVLVGRRFTGEVYSPELRGQNPERRDWILTRILWLSGLELGFNRHGSVDTMRRYIYIHGSPDTAEMYKPGSRGCIRMHNRDILDLFPRTVPGMSVTILEN
ncbi:MAG: L,D-transpeptidase [Oceanospirillales bacterium LUC14_002_19_P2]|nr:MAG: L,D-transpeptidase [Oceanospirillales bacterium LUC14_002_19_P2]